MQIWSYRDLRASASYILRLEVCASMSDLFLFQCVCVVYAHLYPLAEVRRCQVSCSVTLHAILLRKAHFPNLELVFFSCAVFLLKELTPFFTLPPSSLPHLLPHFWGYMCKAPNSDLFLLSKHCTLSHTLNWPVTRSPAPEEEQLMMV